MNTSMDESETPTAADIPSNNTPFDVDNLPVVDIPAPLTVTVCGDGEIGRLIISHITNINFKSYAGTKILGPFQKSFTCIVGPNGSGKSNVIDAMLFVFGFRANKIRSKKLSVLIHNSERHQDVRSCTVKVHFQRIRDTGPEDSDFEVIPGSEFTVSRTAHRDNTSVYYINDRKATAKEVVQLLLSHGIDLDHNRFLILQGEVELISMMKPKAPSEHEDGMLEYLEDIIGSNRFKQPIDTLTLRIDKINELRSEKLNRVKLAEKDKNALEGPKNEAVQYLTLENDITTKKNCIYQKYISDAERNLKEADERLCAVKQSADAVTKEMDSLEEERVSGKKHAKHIIKEFEKLKDLCENNKTAYGELERQSTKAAEDLKQLAAKIKKLEKSIETERKTIADLQEAPEKCTSQIKDLEEEQEDLLSRKSAEEKRLEKAMEGIKTETQELQEKKTKLEEELLKYQSELNEKKSKVDLARVELDLAKSAQHKEEAMLNKMMESHKKAGQGIKDGDRLTNELRTAIPRTEAALQQVSSELAELCKVEEELGSKLSQLRDRVRDYSSQMASSRSQSAQLQALMDQKNSGKIPGIIGRLGDLGAIDDKFDVAISTACPSLDNIVVDTMRTGQQCVDYLKRASLGVCTFILLEKMDQWAEKANRSFQSPDNVPRLFDLVRFTDERLKGPFYFAMRDTLVTEDLKQASRIAFGKARHRVVTLAGQLIEVTGAMSGGGRPTKGKMGSSICALEITPEKLAEMEEKLGKGQQKYESQRVRRSELTTKQEKLVNDLRNMKNQLEKTEMEVKMYQDQEQTLKTEIKLQAHIVKNTTPDPEVIDKLELAFKKHDDEYQKIYGKTSIIEEKSQSIHKQIVELSENKMKFAQEQVNKVTKELEANKAKINKLTVSIKSNSRNLKRAEEKEAALVEELEECRTQQHEIETNQLGRFAETSDKMLQEYNQTLEKCKFVEEEVKRTNLKIEEVEQKQNELKKASLESRRELEKYQATVKECETKRNHWQRELDKLTIHRLPDQAAAETLTRLSEEERESVDVKAIQYQITVLEEQLSKIKPNMAAIAEFRKKEEQYIERVAELDHVTEIRNQQRALCDEMKKQRLKEFMDGFSLITSKLKEMYQMITLGGDAELELVDTLDPFSEGIVFSVRPPKKSWKNISNLSGGEKTLSSLALVFALHHYRPTPLYVMDEIDAALDFKNVSIVANYIKERTKNAQFIIISLRDNMFEQASRLVGIYKTHDTTKTTLISVKGSASYITTAQ